MFIPVAMGAQSKLMKKPGAAGVLKKSTVKKKPGAAAATVKLTPAAVATHEVTTQGKIDLLSKKMDAYKKGKLSECDFDHDDKHKLWDRFHKQLRKKR